MNRRARREQKRKENVTNSRPKQFYDLVAEKEIDTEHSHYNEKLPQEPMGVVQEGFITSAGSVADAPREGKEDRPELSTVVVDEQTGFERIAQGKAVMDVVTRRAVQLSSLGPMYRMAQFSPGVPPEVREAVRFADWNTVTVPQMVEALRAACVVEYTTEDGRKVRDIPPHPQVSNQAIDFVIANRDYLGFRMKKTLGRLKMRAQSEKKLDEAREYRKLWKHFMTLEDHISAPFRQMVLDAEGKVGPNFGSLDVKSYCSGELYERSAAYVVLKAMVAHWEKKVRDADFVEKTPQTRENFLTVLATGDPKRYLPEPPIIFRLDECVKICAMSQQMTAEFANTPELFDDLPVELRFIEKALTIKGGTELRRLIIQEFCPKEEITPEGLREGMRRFHQQMTNMQIDPYGDFTNVVGRLTEAMAVGTDEERDPYAPYLYNLSQDLAANPGYFQTYTFNEDKNSMIRFLDQAKSLKEGSVGGADDIFGQLGKVR